MESDQAGQTCAGCGDPGDLKDGLCADCRVYWPDLPDSA